MSSGNGVVVWEWQEDNDQWMPYDPETSLEIESLSNIPDPPPLWLGARNVAFVPYEVHLGQENFQINTYSMTKRKIKRSVLPEDSSLANGWTWEWFRGSKKTGIWTSYSTELIEYLESQHEKSLKSFQLPGHFNMSHKIDLKRMKQKNINTDYERDIRRVKLIHRYPADSSSSNATTNTASGPPTDYTRNKAKSPTSTLSNLSISSTSSNVASNGASGGRFPTMRSLTATPISPVTSSYNSRTTSTSTGPYSMYPNGPAGTNLSPYQGSHSSNGGAKRKTKSAKKSSSFRPPPLCPASGIPCTGQATTGTVSVDEVLKSFSRSIKVDPSSTDDCVICQCSLKEESGFGDGHELSELNLCDHRFHTECLKASYKHGVKNGCIICPACNKMHGIKTGTQPPGTMHYQTISTALPGFQDVGTICITYEIRQGIQTSEHPHPGRPYNATGFPRIAYLPDNDEGREVLSLLIEAWKRRLIFMVGQSSTTGREDCVTWTGIHHKTETVSIGGHGYPDEGYFDRVKSELEAEGVTPESISNY